MKKKEIKNKIYENYLETRKDYNIQKKEQIHEYAKYLMLVSCGVFGVSFLFIEKMIIPPIKVKYFLLLSWISFSLTIVAIILSFIISSKGFDTEIQILDLQQKNSQNKVPDNIYDFLVPWLNGFAFGAFILGFVYLFIFAYINLN